MENDMQAYFDKMQKEYEEEIAELNKKVEQQEKLISNYEQTFSSFDDQLKIVADKVADHIGKEVVSSFADKFGVDAEATQHAAQFPYQEQSQVALHLLREDGQVMTADEFAAKHSTKSMDEFNYMGGLTATTEQAEVFDPFKEQVAGPTADLDQDTKDIMTAIDYQVQNYTLEALEKNAEPAIAQEVKVSPFSKDRAQAAIRGMRAVPTEATVETPATPGQEPVEAIAQSVPPVAEPVEPMTKQDTEAAPSITAEMQAAAKESAEFMADAEFIRKHKQKPFEMPVKWRDISPSDAQLSLETLFKEMGEEKFNVAGKTNKLVNYLDKTRDFHFSGKTAEEFRNNAIEKNDVKEFLNSFQPGLKAMKDAHESELKLMPFDASDRDIEEMNLKHKVERKFYEIGEKTELSRAHKYFRNEMPENLPNVAGPTGKEVDELKNMFRDYAAHRIGRNWKNTYASQEQDPSNPKRMSKESLVQAMQRNQEIKNIAGRREQSYTPPTPSQAQVKRQIKSMRMA